MKEGSFSYFLNNRAGGNDYGEPELDDSTTLHKHLKDSSEIAWEKIVSRMLNGFVNVAGQVSFQDSDYSVGINKKKKEIFYSDFEKKFPEKYSEAIADFVILKELFKDGDHRLNSHNIKFFKDGTYYLFDFAEALHFWLKNSPTGGNVYSIEEQNAKVRQIVKYKLLQLKKFYSQSGFEHVENILNSTGKKFADINFQEFEDKTPRMFFDKFMQRIDDCLERLNKMEK